MRRLRDHGAPDARQRGAADPVRGQQGQLRQGVFARYGLRRAALYRGLLDAFCAELFRDIDTDAVDFMDNYDGTMQEPTLLPTTFPNIPGIGQYGHRGRYGFEFLRF